MENGVGVEEVVDREGAEGGREVRRAEAGREVQATECKRKREVVQTVSYTDVLRQNDL